MATKPDVYEGISDAQVDELRSRIRRNLHAVDAARALIVHANLCIAAGLAMPAKLRIVLGDALDFIEATDPLLLFGNIRPTARARGRPRTESDREWLDVMKALLDLHREGFELAHPREPVYPFKLMGPAFTEYVKRQGAGNEAAQAKEARRLQAGFWKHVRALPLAQIESLGLAEYLPRKK